MGLVSDPVWKSDPVVTGSDKERARCWYTVCTVRDQLQDHLQHLGSAPKLTVKVTLQTFFSCHWRHMKNRFTKGGWGTTSTSESSSSCWLITGTQGEFREHPCILSSIILVCLKNGLSKARNLGNFSLWSIPVWMHRMIQVKTFSD